MPRETSSHQLLKYAQFVSTITGTVGWEALQMGIPVLVFGDCYYEKLPGTFRFRDNPTLKDIQNFAFDQELFRAEVQRLVNRLSVGVTSSYNFSEMVDDFDCDDNAHSIVSFLGDFV